MRFVKTVENLFSLPQGFTRVEYLQSTGTQYIDLGIGVKSNTVFKATFSIASTATGRSYFGARNSSNERFQIVNSIGIGGGYYLSNTVYPIANQKYEIEMYANGDMYLDGVKRNANTGTFSQVAFERNLWLFATNYYDSSVGAGASTFWKVQIFEGDVLVRDFIPCIDPLGVACMYDLVGKKPYYNQGTGTFTAGRQIIPVEYLEGTGTQYIDTGVRGFADFEIGIQLRKSVSNVSIFCGNGYRLERYNASNPYWRFRNNNDFYNSGISITEYHVMAWKNDEVYADGVKLQDFAKTWNVSANMTLFGASASGSYPSMIYFCKLWNPTDGTLLRDYIPCKDENDNGFLFDKVSGVCYLNNGTGNFAFGENKYKTKLRLVKDNKLPAGYTQVEYLESSGTQRITTDVSVANGDNFNLIVKGAFTTLTGYSQFMGVNGGAYFGLTTTGYYSVGQATGTATGVLADTNNHIFDLNCTIGNNQTNILKIDGTSYSNVRNNSAGDVRLFDVLNSYACYFKMTGATVYKNNILVRDFVPALDPTGTPCMYDMVTKTPFYNRGKGTFSYGKPVLPMVRFIKDIVPKEYATVNYIESTGTQYIDTGIIGTEGVLSEIDVMKTTATTNECFLGTWNSGSARCWLAYAFSNKWYPGYGGTASDMVQVVQNSWTHIRTYITQVSSRKYFGYNINGTDYTLTGYFTSFTGQNTILMFAMNTNTGANYKATGRIGTCKITKDGVLVRNFIPVVRRIDKVAGMWDTVTKQFFTTPVGAFNFG